MANQRQVDKLLKGADVWNRWREKNLRVEINFCGAELWGTNLSNANLSNVNLSNVNLRSANLSNTNLSNANLSNANLWGTNLAGANLTGCDLRGFNFSNINLKGANLKGTNLTDCDLRGFNFSNINLEGANLKGANLECANFKGTNLTDCDLRGFNFSNINLKGANLKGTNLEGANLAGYDLRGFNLSNINLKGANLTDTNLTKVPALDTNFSQAILTGACIEDWNINSDTKLDGVICDYIYLKRNKQERRPSDPNKNFAPGEFTKLFQKALSTVDLIFRNGINWEAFAHSFQQLQVKAGTTDLSIQAIENKGDGDFVIRVNTPPGADKAEIQRFMEQEYQVKLKAIEDKYRYQLQAKEESIAQYRQENTNLWSMAKLMASRPINNIAMAENKDNSNTFQNDFQGAKIANFANQVTDNARQQAHQYNYASSEKQTLAEAAAEIQRLLQQLEETNPSANESQQIDHVNNDIEANLKQRAIAALKAGGDTAIDEFLLENKYLKVTKAIIQAWLQPNS